LKIPRERPVALVLTAIVWHQCSPKRALLDAADPAVTTGRYHQAGGPGVWYASSSENGAWAELFRHHEPGGVSPLEVIRRIGQARVRGLRVLDLTDAGVREILGVSERDLIGDDLSPCQQIADYAHSSGFDAILAPSAALEGHRTVAFFSSAMRKITEGRSRVGSPPARARRLRGRVRM
jgi:RES domain-containing protein